MDETKKTAIIICNYNMPERTDALCEHIVKTVKLPYDFYVVDNGSDIEKPSKFTTVHVDKNRQTAGGFLAGLDAADASGIDYFAYWLFITSAEFKKDNRDPLKILMDVMISDPDAYAVHPATTFNYAAWEQWMSPRGSVPRRIWGTDYIAVLLNAEKFNAIGRLRPELTMMWGVIGECNWKARKNGWHIYIHDGYVIHKETDIGYTMDRMNMSASDRRSLASKQSDDILNPIYGNNYREKFGSEYKETNGEY